MSAPKTQEVFGQVQVVYLPYRCILCGGEASEPDYPCETCVATELQPLDLSAEEQADLNRWLDDLDADAAD